MRMNIAIGLPLCLLIVTSHGIFAEAQDLGSGQEETKPLTIFDAEFLKVESNDDDLRKLLKARYNEAISEVQQGYEQYEAGRISFDSLFDSVERLTRSGLELYERPAEKVESLTRLLEFAKELEKVVQRKNELGASTERDLHRARFSRFDIEIQLTRMKREADPNRAK